MGNLLFLNPEIVFVWALASPKNKPALTPFEEKSFDRKKRQLMPLFRGERTFESSGSCRPGVPEPEGRRKG